MSQHDLISPIRNFISRDYTPLKRQPYGKVDSLIFNFIFHNLPSSRTRPSPPPFVPLPYSFHVNYYTRLELENCYTFHFLFRLRIERYILHDLLSFLQFCDCDCRSVLIKKNTLFMESKFFFFHLNYYIRDLESCYTFDFLN